MTLGNTPNACFHPLGEAVSDARRSGDIDPNNSIIADTMKLVGNSSYGKSITNRERHLQAKFCNYKCNWFPRTDTRNTQDTIKKRQAYLFKVEWEKDGIIGLCSKTYYCFRDMKNKFS